MRRGFHFLVAYLFMKKSTSEKLIETTIQFVKI